MSVNAWAPSSCFKKPQIKWYGVAWKDHCALVVAGGGKSAWVWGLHCFKTTVEAIVRTLAKEVNVKRNTINCAASENNFMGRLGVPEDIEPVIGFLCSDAGELVNGQVIRVNGGMVRV